MDCLSVCVTLEEEDRRALIGKCVYSSMELQALESGSRDPAGNSRLVTQWHARHVQTNHAKVLAIGDPNQMRCVLECYKGVTYTEHILPSLIRARIELDRGQVIFSASCQIGTTETPYAQLRKAALTFLGKNHGGRELAARMGSSMHLGIIANEALNKSRSNLHQTALVTASHPSVYEGRPLKRDVVSDGFQP